MRSALRRNSVGRVAAIFVLALAALLPLSLFSGGWSGWGPITQAEASITGALARMLGMHATSTGNSIWLASRTLVVDPQCTAVDLLAVYASLVIAYPLKWRARLLALVLGAVVLQVANIGRLVGVVWAAESLADTQFNLVHDYLFEFGMVFVVMMMWAVWLSLAKRSA